MKLLKNKKSGNIALIEFYSRQHDIIYPLTLMLDRYYENVYVWIDSNSPLEEKYIEGNILINRIDFSERKTRLKFIRNFNKIITEFKIEKIILNTGQGVLARDFLLRLLFNKIQVYGVLHDTEKLKNSFTQKLISLKIKKYFVLNDYVKNYCDSLHLKKIKIESVYPCFLTPKMKKFLETGFQKSENIKICVAGEINLNRKDYEFFVDYIINYNIPDNIEFVLLGTPIDEKGFNILKLIEESKYKHKIKIFKEFISEEIYNRTIYESDIIATLIHPGIKDYRFYIESKISGAYLSAFSFRKPLLLHNDFKKIDDFKNISFFYDKNNFAETINFISINKESIIKKAKAFSDLQKLDFDYQSKKFFQLINS